MNRTLKVLVVLIFPAALLLVLAVLSLPLMSPSSVPTQPGRIELHRNATPTNIDGNLTIGKTDQYTIHAEAGQTLLALVMSPQRDVVLSIHGADGQTLWHEMASAFFGFLPTTQDYVFSATAKRTPANYRLSLQLAPQVTERPASSFQPRLDAEPVRVEGRMKPGQIDVYRFAAIGEQVANIDVWNSFPGQLEHFQVMDLVINNADGEALYGGNTFWFGELPSSHNYSLHLIPSAWPEGVTEVDYSLSLGLYAPSDAQESTRIEIPTNQPWVTIEGKIIPAGKFWGRTRYRIQGSAGQTLTLHLISEDQGGFTASVRGEDDKLLAADYRFITGFSNSPSNEYSLELPASQEYTISIIGNEGTAYTLRASLRP